MCSGNASSFGSLRTTIPQYLARVTVGSVVTYSNLDGGDNIYLLARAPGWAQTRVGCRKCSVG